MTFFSPKISLEKYFLHTKKVKWCRITMLCMSTVNVTFCWPTVPLQNIEQMEVFEVLAGKTNNNSNG